MKLFSTNIVPSFFWFVGAGIIFGFSIVLPGLSAYTMLEFFGLFEPIIQGARNIDFTVLIPVFIGGVAAVILFSKAISILYEKKFSIMSHIIIGIVIATTVPLFPTCFLDFHSFMIQIILIVCGIFVALGFAWFEEKTK